MEFLANIIQTFIADILPTRFSPHLNLSAHRASGSRSHKRLLHTHQLSILSTAGNRSEGSLLKVSDAPVSIQKQGEAEKVLINDVLP